MQEKDATTEQHVPETIALRQEVSKLKVLETKYREMEEAYRVLVENSLQGLVLFQDNRIVLASQVFVEMTGYTVEEVTSFSRSEASKLIHPEDAAIVLAYVRARLEGKPAPRCYEMRFIRKDGELRWLESTAARTAFQGKPAIQATLMDITERKQAEFQRDAALKALRESDEAVKALLNAPADSALLLEPGGTIITLNEMAANRIGKSVAELVGTSVFDHFSPDSAELRKTQNEKVFRSGKPIRYEDKRQGRWYDNSIYPIFKAQGEVVRVAVFGRDITELKRAHERLRQSNAELQARNEELDAFVHAVAHSLQTRLFTILGYSELLQDCDASSQADKRDTYGQVIMRNALRMDETIRALLRLATVQDLEVQTTPVDMASIVTDACRVLANVVEQYDAEITVPGVWPVALGFGPWIEEVWVNLISNALKYGGRPPLIVLGAEVQDNDMVRLWIRDNGLGLTQQEQIRLFTPFVRLHGTRASGHGLGLSIVRRIAERLGGQAWVESEGVPGHGCTFSFTLPAAVHRE